MREATQHPLVSRLSDQVSDGKMDRREFVRLAALLGVSAGAAYAMAGLPSSAWAAESTPFPPDDPNAKKGGILRVAMRVAKMEDPATYSWIEMSNQSRHIIEYLAMTGPDNITRPMLAERWEPSDDLTVWTIHIRPGVKWHNGEDLTAEHVAWNVRRWLDSALGSSNIGLSTFSAMSEESGETDDKGKPVKRPRANAVEVLDARTIRFNLSKPVLSVPEDCYNYPTGIVHPSFTPPFSDNPVGTGPFTLAELEVGRKCVLRRATQLPDGSDFRYWGGEVYLDEIHYYSFEEDNQLPAFASGDVDALYEFSLEQLELARSLPGKIMSTPSAQTLACRMQVDQKPFDDLRVRQAIVKAIDNSVVMGLVVPEGGAVGENHLVAPIHPEYFPLPPLARDVEGAKRLLAEAGHADGLDIEIAVGNTDGPWHQTVAEAMRDQLQEAGINLAINVMPQDKFWEVWLDVPFGATSWAHRPLGTQVLSLAFRKGVPWNETHFANAEFGAALDAAEATYDVEERRAKMEKVERILQDEAVMVQPLWRPVFTMASDRVQGYYAHPSRYYQLNKVWLS
jgi:peptide/nickel transport system substrate-binding protein